MAQRSLEQTAKLPVQSFGDNVLNEFKREVTHGIYSRRRYVIMKSLIYIIIYIIIIIIVLILIFYLKKNVARVSLSNMQPSFIWVDVSGDKKSDVLNEVVMCTMSAAKVSYFIHFLLRVILCNYSFIAM